MNLSKSKSLILLHVIIIIWGFTGILGKVINLTSEAIVWNRMMIAFATLFIIQIINKQHLQIHRIHFFKYCGIGFIIAIHWICFFEAIKLSTISLALICLSSISLFTAILEPLIQKKRILISQLLLSLMVILGITIVFNYEIAYTKAIILSILSAFFGALFTVLNHQLIQKKHKSMTITTWEMFGGGVMITVYFLFNNTFYCLFNDNINMVTIYNKLNITILPDGTDIIYIIVLALVCTAFAFYASIEVMKRITPFTVNLSVNLEPIYAIILATIFFGEEEKMSSGFYVGSIIILSSILINTLIKQKK